MLFLKTIFTIFIVKRKGRFAIRNKLDIADNLITIDVDTGDVRVSEAPVMLQSIALGSCIALVVYERKRQIGGIAHIMLPGKSPSPVGSTKYAGDAIETLLERTRELGAESQDLEVSIVGGGNVLREGDIPDKVIESVLGYLKESNLRLRGMRVGGFDRRSVFLDTTTGNVYYTEGSNTTTRLLECVERI